MHGSDPATQTKIIAVSDTKRSSFSQNTVAVLGDEAIDFEGFYAIIYTNYMTIVIFIDFL